MQFIMNNAVYVKRKLEIEEEKNIYRIRDLLSFLFILNETLNIGMND